MSPTGTTGPSTPETILWILVVFLLAFPLSLALTPLVRDVALRAGFVDRPDGQRKNHPVPVPRLGGAAVYLAFVLAFGTFLWLFRGVAAVGASLLETHLHLVAACTAVLIVGLADDVLGVSPPTKILVQAAAGLYLYHHGYQIRLISNPFGEPISLGLLALPLTLLWFVGMSNAFNLIDGLDGLAAGIGLFSTSTVLVAALVNERWEVALPAMALGGALFGFLRYNLSPASIFLGDGGALFVGFALAAFAVRGSMKSSTAIAVAAPLLALALPILDTTIALGRRLLAGRSIFEGDTDHIHHRMLRKGLTPQRAVLVLYGVAAIFGALSLLTTFTGQSQVIGVVVIVFSAVTWIGIHQLGYSELADLSRLRRRGTLPARALALNGSFLDGLSVGFQHAASLDELVEALRRAAERLECRKVEVRLLSGGQGEAPQCLPVLQPAASNGDGAVERSWTIPLWSEGRKLGEVTVTRTVADKQVDAEISYALDSVVESFASSLPRVLR